MSSHEVSWQEAAGKVARTVQIMVGAMTAGTCFFLLIALFLRPLDKPPAPLQPIALAWIACALAVAGLTVRAAVVAVVTAKGRGEITSGTCAPSGPRPANAPAASEGSEAREGKCLLAAFQTKTIIGGAIFEGCSFFATVAYLIEGGTVSLALAGVMIVGLALHLPTQARVIDWVERQLEIAGREKMSR